MRVRERAVVPPQNGVRSGNCRHLFQDFPAQLLTNRDKFFALAIRELHAGSDLLAENAILGYQVRMAQPDLFVNRLGDRPQQSLPVHTSTIPAKASSPDGQYRRKRHEIQAEVCSMGFQEQLPVIVR